METADLQGVADSNCSNPNVVLPECNFATTNLKESLIWPPINGEQYYGRGALQIEWNYNYGSFSDIAFYGGIDDKMTLLEDP